MLIFGLRCSYPLKNIFFVSIIRYVRFLLHTASRWTFLALLVAITASESILFDDDDDNLSYREAFIRFSGPPPGIAEYFLYVWIIGMWFLCRISLKMFDVISYILNIFCQTPNSLLEIEVGQCRTSIHEFFVTTTRQVIANFICKVFDVVSYISSGRYHLLLEIDCP